MTTWEIMSPEEWDAWKRKTGEWMFDADWTCYDYIEIVVTIPVAQLEALFAASEVKVEEIRRVG